MQDHHFSGEILHKLCIFDRKFKQKLVLHFYCDSQYIDDRQALAAAGDAHVIPVNFKKRNPSFFNTRIHHF